MKTDNKRFKWWKVQMNKTDGHKSLYGKMMGMTVLPLFILALIITFFSAHSFSDAINKEVKKGLMDLNTTILTLYDHSYPGDYTVTMQEDGLYMLKGAHQINGHFDVIDMIKSRTGMDITIFYKDIRVITTLHNDSGQRLIGTKVNVVVTRDVLEKGEAVFYPGVDIDGKQYFAYYAPIINSDDTVIGMLFVGKPTEDVNKIVKEAVMPIIVIGMMAMLIAAVITTGFTKELIRAIKKIQIFLGEVAKGNLRDILDYNVSKRNDELGEMGRYAVTMQKALIEQVEKDALTGLYNRRYGEKKIIEVQKNLAENFCLVLGDIDYFKKVNDTYGHECGDIVLSEVANILNINMRNKGFAARWGGEEFLLVFENIAMKDAVNILEDILDEIREKEIVYKEEVVHITMTLGVCQGSTDDMDSLIRKADNKLYAGKERGRNQIVQ